MSILERDARSYVSVGVIQLSATIGGNTAEQVETEYVRSFEGRCGTKALE